MPHPFLTAHLANLVLVSYAVPPGALGPFLPRGPEGTRLEVDTRPEFVRSGQEQALVSLVAMRFQQTRILGVRWPGLRHFSQINLRFYVRHGGRRGVVFVRQIVPSRLLAAAGRRWANESIVAAPISSAVKQHHRTIGVEYLLQTPAQGLVLRGTARGNSTGVGPISDGPAQEHLIRVIASKPVTRPGPDSLEHWIKEQQWAFGMDRRGRATVHEMIHPIWAVYPVLECDVRVDFAGVFGPDWGFLTGSEPVSTILAAGSEMAMFPKRRDVGVRWGERTEAAV